MSAPPLPLRRNTGRRPRRRGTGLAELMVSLALGGVLMSAAAAGLAQQLRVRRDREARQHADWAVRDALEILRAELAHASGSVQVLGDTALEMSSVRAFETACEVVSGRLVMGAAAWSTPRVGDSLAMLDTLTRTEWRTTVAAVAAQRGSVRCPNGGTRVTLSLAMPSSAAPLVLPTRVWRVVRYVLYRAGDGVWWLGERACTPACGSAQPMAGPLLSSSQQGMRFILRLDGSGRPQSVDVALRASVGGRTAALSARLPVPR